MKKTTIESGIITNARILGYQKLQQIKIVDRKISSIEEQKNVSTVESSLDLAGDWLSLGGIDLQINGALGLAFPDLGIEDLDKLQTISDFLWQQGIDGFVPTIVTTAVDKIERSLAVIEKFITQQFTEKPTAKILGVHLEGPFLNPEKKGAHPEKYLLPLTIDNLNKVIGKYHSIVKIITLAPELDPTGETITWLKNRGIIVSLGHSLATAAQAKQAFDRGASMVTHAFNAMPSLHHREPGLLGTAIIEPLVFCGLIADGNHVSQTMMKILLAASNYDRGIFLVSDALAPIGLSDGVYPWDSRKITVSNGTAKLADGTLAGTTLNLLAGVENLVRWQICSPEIAIALATESPRKALGLPGMSVGQSANLLRWHWEQETEQLTWQRIEKDNFRLFDLSRSFSHQRST
jgi:N-acetylglucosamine-6-phosphate deacetylase